MDHEFSKIFNKSMALFEISVKNSSWYVDRYSSIFKNDSHEHSCVLNSMFTFLKRSETLKDLIRKNYDAQSIEKVYDSHFEISHWVVKSRQYGEISMWESYTFPTEIQAMCA